jgi:hypothetical protein
LRYLPFTHRGKVIKLASFTVLAAGCCLDIVAVAQSSDVEDVYVLRSLRLARSEATSFCAQDRTGFDKMNVEDQYQFKSVTTRESDGVVTDSNVQTVGTLHACFGTTAEPQVYSFYAEGLLGATSFMGKGECSVVKNDFPEPGARALRCFMTLEGLPSNYAGGLLTTNTITSRTTVGPVSDPPGYVQPSIATVRLWKKRGARN